MSEFRIGQVVVKRYSKALILKNKLFRVVYTEGYGYSSKITCKDPWGKEKVFYESRLMPAEQILRNEQVRLEQLEQDRIRIQRQIAALDKELKEVPKYFPTV